MTDIASDRQNRLRTIEVDDSGMELRPQAALIAVNELHFDRLGRLVAVELGENLLAHHRTIRGAH